MVIITELLGPDLQDQIIQLYLSAAPKPREQDIKVAVGEITLGVQAFHIARLVHTDVKPSSVSGPLSQNSA